MPRGIFTSPLGLVKRWGTLDARPDRRAGIFDGVVVFILRRAVVEVEGGGYPWRQGVRAPERCITAAK